MSGLDGLGWPANDEAGDEATCSLLVILRTDMRITDARLSDARDHEEGLRALHAAANDRVAWLRSIKRDLQSRVDSICSANATTQTPT